MRGGILGMRPDFHGLKIAPSIPKAWDGFEIDKDFSGRASPYHSEKSGHVESGCKSLRVNGQLMEENYIPAELLAKENEVELCDVVNIYILNRRNVTACLRCSHVFLSVQAVWCLIHHVWW